MSEKKAPGKLAHAKGTQKSAKSTTRQAADAATSGLTPQVLSRISSDRLLMMEAKSW